MIYVQMTSYAGLVIGIMPAADNSRASSKDSKGADRADPNDVLCSRTYKITK